MSETSNRRSDDFLKISDQFQLGVLTTESSHPITANLSQTAKRDVCVALGLLFEADGDVVHKYQEFAESGRAQGIKETVLRALKKGGKVFFTGCGSTGRLSIQLVSIWRDFWQQQRARGLACSPTPEDFENRAFSVMAGGDFALIKSVEGFEDFTEFGKKQIGDLGVSAKDVVFAITEGGETSFVIGTAWKGLEVGAKVYFVYNNPDDILCQHVKRSREIIQEPRIETINLTTGPMSITGSTRMQATTIQLCVLLTVLEMVLRDLMKELELKGSAALNSASVPTEFLEHLEAMHANLIAPEFRSQLAKAVSLEESVYRAGHKNNYFADRFGIDVLTDTTESDRGGAACSHRRARAGGRDRQRPRPEPRGVRWNSLRLARALRFELQLARGRRVLGRGRGALGRRAASPNAARPVDARRRGSRRVRGVGRGLNP